MKIGVIGAGSVGLLLAAYLGQAHEVQLVVRRKEQAELLKKHHVQLYQHSEYERTVKAEYFHQQIPSHVDCYFICVKQNNLRDIKSVIKTIPVSTPLIFIQNGMAHLPLLAELEHITAVGIVEHGTKKLSDFQVNHLGRGKITIAPTDLSDHPFSKLAIRLHQEAFPFIYTEEALPLMKQKLLVNSVINPLTALFRVNNGAILENEHIKEIAKKLTDEASLVLGLDSKMAWDKVVEVAVNTRGNTSSMLQDILANRMTEIDAISGYLIMASSVDLPYTTCIHRAILASEGKE